MKTVNKFETWLPLFVGFYNTYLEGDSDIDNELSELDCEYDDLEIDYKEYQKDVSKWFVDKVEELLNDELGIKCRVNYQELKSPKYYNYSTDSVNIEIEFSKKGLKRIGERMMVRSNFDDVKDIIKSDYTSCDGFISSYSNNILDWQIQTNNWTDFSSNGHYLGKVLEMLLRVVMDEADENVMSDFFESGIYLNSYITNYDELLEKQEQE